MPLNVIKIFNKIMDLDEFNCVVLISILKSGGSGKVVDVSVTDCKESDVCVLTKGQNVTFTVIFVPCRNLF